MQPEACVTAMRQLVAQQNTWPLDKVRLTLRPLTTEQYEGREALLAEKQNCFLIHGLMLEGAEWSNNVLQPSEEIRFPLDEVVFEWSCLEHTDSEMSVPMYLNDTRSDLLCVVETLPKEMWSERAVALIAWRQA